MVSGYDVWESFINSVRENNVGKEISLGRAFFNWRCDISEKDLTWDDQVRFDFLEAIWEVLVDIEGNVFSDVGKRGIELRSLRRKEEITADEQSLLEQLYGQFLDAFENSLPPLVHKFFTTPKEDQNEALLCFPPEAYKVIILKILNHDEYTGEEDEHMTRYNFLCKDLAHVLNFFKHLSEFTEFQQVKILLAESVTIALEILSLVYSFVFDKLLMPVNLFDDKIIAIHRSVSHFHEKHFSMVSGFDIPEKIFTSLRENNEGNVILLAKAFFTSWSDPNETSCWGDRIRCHILKYALNFPCNHWHGSFRDMNERAEKMKSLLGREEIKKYEKVVLEEFCQEILSLFPEVHRLFTIPQRHLHQSALDDLSCIDPYHESLSCFINFLLEISSCAKYKYARKLGEDEESNEENNDDEEHISRYGYLLSKELTFLFTILGDMPFQLTDNEPPQRLILLAQFETISVEIGSLIYSSIFEKLTSTVVNERRDAVIKKISLLNSYIKEHCIEFSDLRPIHVAQRSTNPIDSIFIVDSLIQDLENLSNSQFDFAIVEMVNEVHIFEKELKLSLSLLKDMYKQPRYMGSEDLLLRESLIKIRDVAHEGEYLINAHVLGNAPVWYLKLRLPSVVSNIKITNTAFQDNCVVHSCSSNIIKNTTSKETPSDEVENLVAGFEENRAIFLNDLISGPEDLTTICIYGMAGLGKTTTTRKLYNDLNHHFDQCAWCVVSQEYEKRRVLLEIFTSLGIKTSKDKILKLEDAKIGLKIYKRLYRRRYLIVIDDVWQSNALDDLNQYFPNDRNGSRIIVTTRIENVAPSGCILRPLSLLSEVQSWDLLKDKVFLNQTCPPELIELGKAIAANCRGLPLALVVTAGVLKEIEMQQSSWERVMKELDTRLLDDNNSYRKILEKSFEYLPNHLKLCFLYLGVFPEDTEIHIGTLIHMWIAERFVQKTEQEDIEDVAKGYLNDLISRSLLVTARRGTDGSIKTLTIHDLLRDMCIRRAHEENFIKCIQRDEFLSSGRHRCLVFRYESEIWRNLAQCCRTYVGNVSNVSDFGFLRMPLLRVMDIRQRISIAGFVPDHLRYLAFCRMPQPIEGIFSNLEYLHIQDRTHVKILPSFILKMLKLRHLRVKEAVVFSENCEIPQTNNLRYFSCIEVCSRRDREILKCSPNLRRLKCRWDEEVFHDFFHFTELESLTLIIKRNSRLVPEYLEMRFPETIKKLHLWRTKMPWENMSIIRALPNLLVLKLSYNSFMGEEWDTTDGEFPELRFLKLEELDLMRWNCTDTSEHFPKLEHLVVNDCDCLQEIPSDFGFHTPLQKVELLSCNEELQESAAVIEKVKHEYGDEGFQVIIRRRP